MFVFMLSLCCFFLLQQTFNYFACFLPTTVAFNVIFGQATILIKNSKRSLLSKNKKNSKQQFCMSVYNGNKTLLICMRVHDIVFGCSTACQLKPLLVFFFFFCTRRQYTLALLASHTKAMNA